MCGRVVGRVAVLLLVLVPLICCATVSKVGMAPPTSANSASTSTRPDANWIRGGILVGVSSAGNCLWKAFIKVADTEDAADDGQLQILGFSPGNLQMRRGTTNIILERVPAANFVARGQILHVHCRCPDFIE